MVLRFTIEPKLFGAASTVHTRKPGNKPNFAMAIPHPVYLPLPPAGRAKPFLGIMRNVANSGAVFTQDGYTLAIVEIDDEAVCYDRRQMQVLAMLFR